ncbi:hypothetical protein [Lysinibacillus sp. fls2-241-R2A-57]|uniref:hypothetical protein n=1 Tax=Lysinibacillus sp. fls2-241-R2A-57 TaxID=3040292 RepID=UPI002554E691|nr:hypothetical protein [Lysinibacillus sp. fls2-241-R2A-57]
MENNFILNLEMPGMVIFDPLTVTDYLREKGILTNDLLAYFVSNEEIGKEVITKGIIIPIYPIPEWDYSIMINQNKKIDYYTKIDCIQFETDQFPLTVTSELVIISDISAITIDWEADFFLNYEKNLDSKSDISHYTKMPIGNYGVSIIGYSKDKTDMDSECGYVFYFLRVNNLPAFDFSKSIDEYDFVIEPLNKFMQ